MGHWFESSVAHIKDFQVWKSFFYAKYLKYEDLGKFCLFFSYLSCGGTEAENSIYSSKALLLVSKLVS